MMLRGLKPDTSYAVSVSAVNQVGVGYAAKVRVMTSPATGLYSYIQFNYEQKASSLSDYSLYAALLWYASVRNL